jgi:hypothetical protein
VCFQQFHRIPCLLHVRRLLPLLARAAALLHPLPFLSFKLGPPALLNRTPLLFHPLALLHRPPFLFVSFSLAAAFPGLLARRLLLCPHG